MANMPETVIKPEMFWIDLETTGLDAQTDVPLEIGVVLTDKYLNVVDTWQCLVWEENEKFLMAKANCIPFVKDMHVTNGLWVDLDDPHRHKLERGTIDGVLIDWLSGSGIEPGTLPMAGSSIGSLDRPFVQEHFPALNEFLHYRNIDISSVKELCRLWRPDILEAFQKEQPSEAKWHRVLEDCAGSIEEYKFYIQSGFIEIPTAEFLKIK